MKTCGCNSTFFFFFVSWWSLFYLVLELFVSLKVWKSAPTCCLLFPSSCFFFFCFCFCRYLLLKYPPFFFKMLHAKFIEEEGLLSPLVSCDRGEEVGLFYFLHVVREGVLRAKLASPTPYIDHGWELCWGQRRASPTPSINYDFIYIYFLVKHK